MPYVPVDGRPWRLAMGLRPLDPARWLEVDGGRRHELELKHRLLDGDHDRVVATQPGSEPGGAELLRAVLVDLEGRTPALVERLGAGCVREVTTGREVDLKSIHPVEVASNLVQEDLCLMEARRDEWILTAASVCFPSRWRLADKIGCGLDAIHGPVPGYSTSLAAPTAAFFDRLRAERPVWRLNWTLIDAPDLHQPDPSSRQPAAPGGPAEVPDLWFRVERQTLRRLEQTGAVVFTIRTYVAALADLAAAHPEVVTALRDTLPTVPAETLAYKGWTHLVDALVAWLGTFRPAGAST
jgi:hypothetical protein